MSRSNCAIEPPPTSSASVVPMSRTGTPSAAARSRSMVIVDLRRVEGQRVLDDDELAGGLRLLPDLLGHLVDLLGVADGLDARTGSAGRRRCRAATAARRRRPARRRLASSRPWMSCWICRLRPGALGPVLQHQADEGRLVAAADADDREDARRAPGCPWSASANLVDVGLGVVAWSHSAAR